MKTYRRATSSRGVEGAGKAFTLLELLVVLAIIGILASIALPSLKGMRLSNGLAAAGRQVLDDVALARRLAIQNRTTVLMVFLPPADPALAGTFSGLNKSEKNTLLRGQHTSYALYSVREVGDQPGQAHARYLKSWTALPDGFLIPAWKFDTGAGIAITNFTTGDVSTLLVRRFDWMPLPVPTLTSPRAVTAEFPYIAFGPEGKLQRYDSGSGSFVDLEVDEVVPLARGGLFLTPNATDPTILEWVAPDVTERPVGNSTNNYNLVVVDHVTGRGRLVRPEIP